LILILYIYYIYYKNGEKNKSNSHYYYENNIFNVNKRYLFIKFKYIKLLTNLYNYKLIKINNIIINYYY